MVASTLSERERVRLNSGPDAQREHVVLAGGRRDQVVQALAVDAHHAVVDVGAGAIVGDRVAVEQDRDIAASGPTAG